MLAKHAKPINCFLFSALILMFSASTAAAHPHHDSASPEIIKAQFSPGTDSKGSYSFEDDTTASMNPGAAPQGDTNVSAESAPSSTKSEGSKAKPEMKKSEGSKGKSSPHTKGHHYKGHGYAHKKGEGSKGKFDSHGKGHHYKGHSYGHKGEGSKGKSYSHGKGHHRKGHGYAHKGEGSKGGHGYGKHGRHHHKVDPFHHVLRFKNKLMLSDEQIAELKQHEFEYRKTKIQAKADKAIAKMELDRLAHSDTVDESAIRAVGQRLIEAKAKKIKAKIEAKIAVLKILTPEQRKRVKKMHSRYHH